VNFIVPDLFFGGGSPFHSSKIPMFDDRSAQGFLFSAPLEACVAHPTGFWSQSLSKMKERRAPCAPLPSSDQLGQPISG
jgi:hypothetical protein